MSCLTFPQAFSALADLGFFLSEDEILHLLSNNFSSQEDMVHFYFENLQSVGSVQSAQAHHLLGSPGLHDQLKALGFSPDEITPIISQDVADLDMAIEMIHVARSLQSSQSLSSTQSVGSRMESYGGESSMLSPKHLDIKTGELVGDKSFGDEDSSGALEYAKGKLKTAPPAGAGEFPTLSTSPLKSSSLSSDITAIFESMQFPVTELEIKVLTERCVTAEDALQQYLDDPHFAQPSSHISSKLPEPPQPCTSNGYDGANIRQFHTVEAALEALIKETEMMDTLWEIDTNADSSRCRSPPKDQEHQEHTTSFNGGSEERRAIADILDTYDAHTWDAVRVRETLSDEVPSSWYKLKMFSHYDLKHEQRKPSRRCRVDGGSSWRKGTGFGGGRAGESIGTSETVARAQRAQKEIDDRIGGCLTRVTEAVLFISSLEPPLISLGDGPLHTVVAILQACKSLPRILRMYLRNDSLVDIGTRKQCYVCIFDFLNTMANDALTVALLVAPLEASGQEHGISSASNIGRRGDSCASLVEVLFAQADMFVRLQQSSVERADFEVLEAFAVALQIISVHKNIVNVVQEATFTGMLPSAPTPFFTGMLPSAPTPFFAAPPHSSTTEEPRKRPRKIEDHDLKVADDGAVARYLEALRPQRFEQVALMEGIASGSVSHSLVSKQSSAWDGGSSSRGRMARIAKEISSLMATLPVEYGSSIFVRADEDRIDVMKALIIGPEGTPYENGCFEFDILLPSDYPDNPPKVQLATTGGGRVRFNPNLYACGKVCLSLLGTWSGPGWDREASTLLQVLISIQSLVLVPDPYFNEPGFERSMGTDEGNGKNAAYNAKIRCHTMQLAILEALKKPSPIFGQVVRDHFRLKASRVLAQLRKWSDESAGKSQDPYSQHSRPDNVVSKSKSGDNTDRRMWESTIEEIDSLLVQLNLSSHGEIPTECERKRP